MQAKIKTKIVINIILPAVLTVSAIIGFGSFFTAILAEPLIAAYQTVAQASLLPDYGKRFAIAATYDLKPNDLFKGQSSSSVYYLGTDYKRYVFPNQKTYHTWYKDFSNIITVADSELANFPLGGNVTYRPGIRLVKIQSVPKVYAVDNGAYLRWVPTEAMAKELYGDDWNKQIDDVPVTSWIDYTEGLALERASNFNRQTVITNSPDITTDWVAWRMARKKATQETEKPTVFPRSITGGGGGGGTSSPSPSTTPSPTPSPSPAPTPIPGDITSPVITNIIVSNITSNGAVISWGTSEPVNFELFYSHDLTNFLTATSSGAMATTHSIMLTNLNSNTTYYYKIIAQDVSGNSAESAVNFFRTIVSGTLPIDTTAPVTTASPRGGAYTSAQTVSLSINETAIIYYTLNGATPSVTSFVYSSPIVISEDTTLRFFAIDTAGNREAIHQEAYDINIYIPPTPTPTPTPSPSPLPSGSVSTAIDLGDLNIPADRIPQWYPPLEAEAGYNAAKNWPEYDVTCATAPCSSGKNSYRSLPALANYSPVTTADFSNMDEMTDNAPNGVVLYLPVGTYLVDRGEAMTIARSNIVIRGAGLDRTILMRNATGSESPGNNCETGGMIASVCNPNYLGSLVAWTGGFERGATNITVANPNGFSVGGWIRLAMEDTTACEYSDTSQYGGARKFAHIAKIVSINGNNIVIDRGLRFKYNGVGCTGFEAAPYNPVINTGIENLTMTSTPSIPVGGDWQTNIRYIFINHIGAANSWVVGVKMDRTWERWAVTRDSARLWFQGNTYSNLDETIGYNTEGMYTSNSTDIVWENNICSGTRVCVENYDGAEGIIHSYNYFRQNTAICERSIFHHGHYSRENLLEGNDVNCNIMIDQWWGRNGPRITYYRNRNVANMCGGQQPAGITIDYQRYEIAASFLNIIGNTAGMFVPRPGGNSCGEANYPYSFSSQIDNLWVEKNAYRFGHPYSFDIGSERNRSCGVGENDACPGTNKNTSSPDPSWNGSYPASLYRTSAPSWWCRETISNGGQVCDWSERGIGAWGDNFNGTLCKLPAQIRAEGGNCTPIGYAAPVCGDNVCNGSETCGICAQDCGSCQVCGNNIREGTEACDGASLNSNTCQTRGYDAGTLSCNSSCQFNESQCVRYCGNGNIDSGENCDGNNLGGATCQSRGFASGTLTCGSTCVFNTSSCVAAVGGAQCGNNVVEGTEVCDGTNLNNQTCSGLGYDSGVLSCNANCSFNTLQCVQLPATGLVTRLSFDDGTGTTASDSSGNGKNATMFGAGWTSGRNGGAAMFDGVDDYIEILGGTTICSASHTVSGWFKAGAGSSNGQIYSESSSYSSVVKIGAYLNANGNLVYSLHVQQSPGEILVSSPGQYNDNTWHHFAVVRDAIASKRFILYMDGVEVAASNLTNTPYCNGSLINIGRRVTSGGNVNYFNGAMDDISIYNRALTASEIAGLYN